MRLGWLRWRRGPRHPFHRGLFTAWGFSNGQFTPQSFAQEAQSYEWAVLQWDDHGNPPRWPAFRDACRSIDSKPGVWVTDAWNLIGVPEDSEFVVAELESEGDYMGCIEAIEDGLLPVPYAVITNFTPLTDSQGVPQPQKAAPLIAAGFQCLTECDLPVNGNATPPRLAFTASELGWAHSQPTFYCYSGPRGDFDLSSYSEWFDYPGWSVWLAEYVL